MLTLYVKYTAKPGCRENYVRDIVSEGILTTIRAEEGCIPGGAGCPHRHPQ